MKKKGIIIIIAVVVVILLCLLWSFLYVRNNPENANNVVGNQTSQPNSTEYVIEGTKENFDKEVLKSDKKVLVCFYAEYSEESRKLLTVLEEVAKEKQDIKVVKVNSKSEQNELFKNYNIQLNPTLIVIENGQEINRTTNATEKSDILNLVK